MTPAVADIDTTSVADGDGDPGSGELNLKQVARELGVHYMTAYRYVRSGRLPARRAGTAWVVDRADLAGLTAAARRPGNSGDGLAAQDDAGSGAAAGTAADRVEAVDRVERLRRHLVVGDEAGSWSVVEDALVAGWDPERVLVDLISAAVARTEVADGPAAGHLAVTTATRLLAVVSARFRRPGRTRGSVVVGAPTGEGHNFGLAVVADVLRLRNLEVLDLGVDVPAAAFADAVASADRPVAVGVGVSSVDRLEAARAVVAGIHAVDPDLPVLLGGQAVRSEEVARVSGATTWAADARGAADRVAALAVARAAAAARSSGRRPATR